MSLQIQLLCAVITLQKISLVELRCLSNTINFSREL